MVSNLYTPAISPLPPVASHPTCRARTFIFTTLAAIVRETAPDWFLDGLRPITVFAPNDQAFGNMPQDEFDDLLAPNHERRLIELILHHVVPGRWTSSDLCGQSLRAVNGERVKVHAHDHGLRVNGAGLIHPDLAASNGIVHEIDRVLTPGQTRQLHGARATHVSRLVKVPLVW